MKSSRKYFLLLYSAPFLYYLLIILKIRPELAFIYSPTAFYFLTFTYVTFVVFIWWKFEKKQKPIKIFLISGIILFIHFILISFILFTKAELYDSDQIKFKQKYSAITIYIINDRGFLKPNKTEIGYSFNYSPIYHTYYSTKNFIEYTDIKNGVLLLTEYKNELIPLKDSKRLFPESKRKDIQTIRIELNRIK